MPMTKAPTTMITAHMDIFVTVSLLHLIIE